MVYERVDSWYLDGAKTPSGEAHLVRAWIVISFPEGSLALTYHPFEKTLLIR